MIKASNLNLTGEIPMLDAADSSSRIAKHANPAQQRVNHQQIANTVIRKNRQRKKLEKMSCTGTEQMKVKKK